MGRVYSGVRASVPKTEGCEFEIRPRRNRSAMGLCGYVFFKISYTGKVPAVDPQRLDLTYSFTCTHKKLLEQQKKPLTPLALKSRHAPEKPPKNQRNPRMCSKAVLIEISQEH